MMNTARKPVILLLVCLLLCLAAVSCKKTTDPTPDDVAKSNDWVPVTPANMAKAGFAENPTNLNVKLYNTGTKTISKVCASIGKLQSEPCVLKPSAETAHLFTMYPIIEQLSVSFADDQGGIHARATDKIYKIFPKRIKGNLDLAVYIDSGTNEVTFIWDEE